MLGSARTAAVIRAAVEAFNHGDQAALSAHGGPDAVHPQPLLGCLAARTCAARRPIPVVAGEGRLALIELREVGEDRAVCTLATDDGIRLVGLYAVHDGRIAAACHYLSDTDMLTELGVLPLTDVPSETRGPDAPPAVAATDAAPSPASIGEGLLEVRLVHRQHRLRLAIHALDLRVEALTSGGRPIPRALTAAIRGFQQELDDTQPCEGGNGATPHDRQAPVTAPGVDEVFPGTAFVGSCAGCRRLVFALEPHEWQDVDTGALCLPEDDGAVLYCGACSDRSAAARRSRVC